MSKVRVTINFRRQQIIQKSYSKAELEQTDRMVNMKIILLVSLAVVISQALPVEHREKRDIWSTLRDRLTDVAETGQRHVQNARDYIQDGMSRAREHFHDAGDSIRERHQNTMASVRDIWGQLTQRVGDLDNSQEGELGDVDAPMPIVL